MTKLPPLKTAYFAERVKQGTIESLKKYYVNQRTLPQLPKTGNGDEKADE